MQQFNQRKENHLSFANNEKNANEIVQNTNCQQQKRRIRCCGRVFNENELSSKENEPHMTNGKGKCHGNDQRMANGHGNGQGKGKGRSQQI